MTVREVVRAVFRNPENGTPDNINRSGCLALARASNYTGGKLQGHIVWNAWRAIFPVVHIGLSGTLYSVVNTVDFSNWDFCKPGFKSVNFSRMRFGERAEFSNTNFDNRTQFNGCEFESTTRFVGSTFGDFCTFTEALFLGFTNFQSSQFGSMTNFSCVQFEGEVDFFSAQLGNNASFLGAYFGGDSNFGGAQLGDSVNFSGAQFQKIANFSGCTWDRLKQPYGDKFEERKQWSLDRGISPAVFLAISFAGCTFSSKVGFTGREFLSQTNFSLLKPSFQYRQLLRNLEGSVMRGTENELLWQATNFEDTPVKERSVRFATPPKFHSCKLHQDTTFESAEFPKPTGEESAARAYRTLKLAFSQQQAIREDQRFFKLEMAEETAGAKWFQIKAPYIGAKPLYLAYQWFSDFGFSVARPMLLWAAAVLGFAYIYGGYSPLITCYTLAENCQVQTDWLQYSLAQSLPLPGLDKLPLIEKSANTVATGWLVLHKTISLAALFLAGLALRNLFKLK